MFDLGSATFDLTASSPELDAYVEPGARMVDEVPGMRRSSRASAAGTWNNSPYDLAAAALCLAGGRRDDHDAAGAPLGAVRWARPDEFHILGRAAVSELHTMLVDAVAERAWSALGVGRLSG